MHWRILCLFLLVFMACKDEPKSAITDSNTFGPRLDSLFQDAITQKQIPGGIALVAQSGKIVYHKAMGYHSIE